MLKYIGIYLTEYTQDLRSKNYKQIKHWNKWKDIPSSWISRLNIIIKMAMLPKLIYRFNGIPTEIPGGILRNWWADYKV